MATTRALAATGEVIEDSELSVTSALDVNVKATLPVIDDGGTTTVAEGYQVLVNANGAGDVEIVDTFGRRVVMVQAGESISIKANGDVDRPVWTFARAINILAVGQAQPSSGGTTAALGSTCPAASATVKWIGPVQLLDGTVAYLPCWT